MILTINTILFNDFTGLDVFGPLEVLSRTQDLTEISYFSKYGGVVKNSINVEVHTKKIDEIEKHDILLIPGGFGTRNEIQDIDFLNLIKQLAVKSQFVLCVCTGSALLAKTGLLDNKNATSNKKSWNWVIEQNTNINWIRNRRWIRDEKYYTSSGVSAGIDMALGFVSDQYGIEIAKEISRNMEYNWNDKMDIDLF